jgi:hypothetical protein
MGKVDMTIRLSLAKLDHLSGVSVATVVLFSSSERVNMLLKPVLVSPSSMKSDFSGVNATQLPRVQPEPRRRCGLTVPSLKIEKHSPICSVPGIYALVIQQ